VEEKGRKDEKKKEDKKGGGGKLMEHPEYVKLQRSRDVSAECIVQNARITSEIVPAKRPVPLS
jgi:hypothetical protein